MAQLFIFYHRFKIFLLGCFIFSVSNAFAQPQQNWKVEKPLIVMEGISNSLSIEIIDEVSSISVVVNGEQKFLAVDEGIALYPFEIDEETIFNLESQYGELNITVDPIPMWFSVIPPLIAILVALLFKEVFTALFTGIFVGTFTIYLYYGEGILGAIMKGFFAIVDDYVIQALKNTGHISIIVFSMMIGGMVQVITKNGGMRGVVNFLSRYAKTKRSGQLITWLLGIAIFFDDYANTLVVGNTMRPVADRLKISREKLAYIVDSTAAPVASIALITTWVGAELSYIQDGIKMLNLDETPYIVFLHSLKYAFYPLFTLGFMLMIIITGRDFGPMRKAEIKVNDLNLDVEKEDDSNEVYSPKKGIKTKAYNALIPVFVVVIGTIAGLIITGLQSASWKQDLSFYRNLSEIIGNADSYKALLWSSLSGVFVAVVLSISQGLLTLKESMESLVDGFKVMLTAILILTLAWALAALTENIHTAQFISNSLINLHVSPYLVPGLAFVLAALVAFSTGSSWGTMAILYPLMLPAIWLLSKEAGLNYDDSLILFHNVVSVILAGSVLGDHCSPISDTTIMSSLASQCNHIEHVRTQLPYALSVGGVSLLIGTVPVAYGLPLPIAFILGFLSLFIIVRYLGKKQQYV